jgi:hypothetical protein
MASNSLTAFRTTQRSKSVRSIAGFCHFLSSLGALKEQEGPGLYYLRAFITFLNFCTSDLQILQTVAVLSSHF